MLCQSGAVLLGLAGRDAGACVCAPLRVCEGRRGPALVSLKFPVKCLYVWGVVSGCDIVDLAVAAVCCVWV